MKKIIFTLLALVGTMSMNAQVMKPGMEIMKNGVVVATYTADQADEVVFKEVPTFPFGQGEAEATGIGKVKWVQLWENGPKFAEYNVGEANNKAEDYGGYYCWGKSADKDAFGEYKEGDSALTGDDDTATKLWGSNWRMPTQAELEALLNNQNCTCTWTENYNETGVKGLLCKGKENTAYSSNSVFLPAAGYCGGGDVFGQGYGVYWSSTPDDGNFAYFLSFDSGSQFVGNGYRSLGYSVRAVLKETPATTGVAKATIGGVETDVNWVQLWENGPKFAEYNVGVTDGKAESYGGYYCWGSSIDKDLSAAYKEGTDALTGNDDTATALWGSNWRMPTKAELDDLLANCDVAWTTVNGVNGRKFTGKGDFASNSVFLPAAGGFGFGSVYSQGYGVSYWSSTPNGDRFACILYFESGSQYVYDDYRDNGYSVRAVLAE